jgi:hypothetical protein
VAKDKRIKMKIEIVDDLHYILYTPSGQKYHFEKKVFNKTANWSRDLNNGTILSRGRAFMTFQFVSKIFYLTKIEDVHGNAITYQYEKTFDAITKNGSGKSYDTGIRTNMLTALNIVPILLLAPPPGSDGGTTEVFLHEIMLKIANQVDMAKGLGETSMEPGANFDSFMQMQAPYFAMSFAMEPILKLVVQLVGLVPYPYRPLAVLAAYTLCYADSSEVNMKYYVEYTVEGWRPSRIVDTLGRNIDLTYRGAYDPNTIRDSQLSEIKYLGPNGENNVIKYTYNNNDMLVRVDYPAGNPVEYEYQFFDQGLTDEKIMDDGYLLTKVHHPSGFESQYAYRWYEPKADVTAFTDQLTPDENKAYSYYVVKQKTHSAVGQNPRSWQYDYTRGSTYYQYIDEPTAVSKRWQFKSHTITDPQGLVTEEDFVIGQLERLRTPQIAQGTPYVTEHLILNLYDMKTGLLISQNVLIHYGQSAFTANLAIKNPSILSMNDLEINLSFKYNTSESIRSYSVSDATFSIFNKQPNETIVDSNESFDFVSKKLKTSPQILLQSFVDLNFDDSESLFWLNPATTGFPLGYTVANAPVQPEPPAPLPFALNNTPVDLTQNSLYNRMIAFGYVLTARENI